MKHIYAMVLIAALSIFAGGDTGAVARLDAGRSDAVCVALMKNGASKELLAQQACCEKNQGVCGCRAGKIVCCDKSFSPTCTC
jgi:hypothetical protein